VVYSAATVYKNVADDVYYNFCSNRILLTMLLLQTSKNQALAWRAIPLRISYLRMCDLHKARP